MNSMDSVEPLFYSSGSSLGNIEASILELPYDYEDYPEIGLALKKGIYVPNTDAWLSSIYVDPRYRLKQEHVGSKLMEGLLQTCVGKNVRRIIGSFINSPDSREEVVKEWYLRKGFDFVEPLPDITFVFKDLS